MIVLMLVLILENFFILGVDFIMGIYNWDVFILECGGGEFVFLVSDLECFW